MKSIVDLSNVLLGVLLCALSLSLTAYGGDTKITKKDVPSAVLKSFAQAYPKATVKGYAKEVENGTTYYELESVDGTTKRDLLYAPDGKAAEIEETVTMKDLPDVVARAFAKESPSANATKIEKNTKGEHVNYEFAMGKGKTELVIDPSGTIVKHSMAAKAKKEN